MELLAGEVASWKGLQGNSAWYFLMSWLFRNFTRAEIYHSVLKLTALPTHRTAYKSSSIFSFTELLACTSGTRCGNRTRLFSSHRPQWQWEVGEWKGGHRKLAQKLFWYFHGCHYVCIWAWEFFISSVSTGALRFLLLYGWVWDHPRSHMDWGIFISRVLSPWPHFRVLSLARRWPWLPPLQPGPTVLASAWVWSPVRFPQRPTEHFPFSPKLIKNKTLAYFSTESKESLIPGGGWMCAGGG